MNKKRLAEIIILIAFLFSTLFSAKLVNSQTQVPRILILSNGSVVGTDKIHQNGNVYILTENLNASIVIEKDNIVLDGAGFTLQGSANLNGDETGISLTGITNIKIENLNITGFNHAIVLYKSSQCTISHNTIHGGNVGVYMNSSVDNWVNQNKIETTEQDAMYLLSSSRNVLSENIIVNNLGTGICVDDIDGGKASANIISTNNFTNNSRYNLGFGDIGILSSNNIIIGNTITNSTGIQLFLHHASGNLFTKNSVSNSTLAFSSYDAGENNTFLENNIVGNKVAVLYGGIVNDTFYRNNFINNTMIQGFPAYGMKASPNWDNGTFGNYYSDYLTKYPSAKEIDSSGTYGTPYEIYVYGTYLVPRTYVFYDNHPLVDPIKISQETPVIPTWAKTAPTNNMVSSIYLLVSAVAIAILICVLAIILFKHNRTLKKR
jgi:parallel beta-helix repeat protein